MILPPAAVPRHQARVIQLQYCGEGPIQKTLMLVGKVRGILYLLLSVNLCVWICSLIPACCFLSIVWCSVGHHL